MARKDALLPPHLQEAPVKRRRFLSAAVASGLALAARAADRGRQRRVAVIGHTGRGDYGHGLDVAWLRAPGAEGGGGAAPGAKGLAAARKRLNGARGFAGYRPMLAEVKPDVVAICPRYAD